MMLAIKSDKIRLIKVWEALSTVASEYRPMSVDTIVRYLALEGIASSHTTVSWDVKLLNQFKLGIVEKRGGEYLTDGTIPYVLGASIIDTTFVPSIVPDYVEKLTLNYVSERDGVRETITVDAASSLLTVERIIGSKKVTEIYEANGEIVDFMDAVSYSFWGESFETSADIGGDCDKNYRAVITYVDRPQKVVEGVYDREGVPHGWEKLMGMLRALVRGFGMDMILSPEVYRASRLREGEHIYLSVCFGTSEEKYYYLTDRTDIRVGDTVVVPVGVADRGQRARVASISVYDESTAPYPVRNIKKILGKAGDVAA